ncbi:hypothetical protein ACRE_060460 [Hapsidospora chrysogenum ATCC 11550]|uniref:T6SS Phospholipase effector Tle1-like catalytic domain-containing protein n=1 Tax=Hapsidospora chrysogenum (strain ATCC 11550 / CBS 779.69 / DSM 880 / IAM 14645 / JCM 23072 / IMI 49137) TaxID=857340 RepID=A0A086T1K7_HAPC1|nr:hypothetical protein ACRE_060460 [Hapsidospora chrysogenum ATCC 11550]
MDPNRLDPSSASVRESRHSGNFSDPEEVLSAANVAANKASANAANAAAKSRGVRKLVLCFDGTGNKFHGDDSDSNILKIFRMLDRTADDQYHYYQPGIGTYVVSGSLTHTSVRARLNSWYQKAKDSAVGSSFDQHVVGGYRFLMRFYNPGDEIYMFGFSRGAYIARFLAEMLDYIGLLSHGNEEMVKFAWKAFSQWQCRQQSTGSDDEVAAAESEKRRMYTFMKGFRETFSRPVGRIRFLGLFDTVNSVPRFETAWMQRSKFPYTARSSAKVIRHAVSIDERRAKFRQDLMYQDRPRVRSHRRRHHLGEWFAREHWNLHHRHNGLLAEKDDEKTAHERDDEGRNEEGGATSPDQRGTGMSQESQRPEGRGRSRDQFLSPLGPNQASQRRGSLAQQSRGSDAQRRGSQAEFAPYRARSASRRRLPSQQRQQQHLEPGANSELLSDLSGQALSGIAPDWLDDDDDEPQDIDEVWFAGGHADVGGGWEMLEESKSASHVPLAWIVREAMRAGLPFDADKVAEMGCACGAEWDGLNPARRHPEIKKQRRQERRRQRRQMRKDEEKKGGDGAANIPDIRMDDGADPAFPESPEREREDPQEQQAVESPIIRPSSSASNSSSTSGSSSSSSSSSSSESDEDEHHFHGLMSRAHTARIHDSLAYGGGLSHVAVCGWKMMEYMPFRRMDLKPDGSWEPIRWPLPRGEVRDVPDNVRVHGSVIRRMEADKSYRPGNLIIGGGGRGVRRAPSKYGIGEWVCVAERGDPIGEIWMRKNPPEVSSKLDGEKNGKQKGEKNGKQKKKVKKEKKESKKEKTSKKKSGKRSWFAGLFPAVGEDNIQEIMTRSDVTEEDVTQACGHIDSVCVN